jgi:hypothetical protein
MNEGEVSGDTHADEGDWGRCQLQEPPRDGHPNIPLDGHRLDGHGELAAFSS